MFASEVTNVILIHPPGRYPGEVVVTDVADESGESGANTPGGAADDDDFFSSWDKPAIKRPSNPPSRTGTPGLGVSRSASPFLNPPANANGAARPKSPLNASETSTRAIPAAARKPASSTGAKKNILGAKKTKLGAKKVDPAALDFDAAERKAREEAERIAKLGYDPDAETPPSETQTKSAQHNDNSNNTSIISPTPLSPPRSGGFGSTAKSQESEVDKAAAGVRRLGFGQVGGGAGAAPAAAPKKMGFGSVSRGAAQGEFMPHSCFTETTQHV